MSKTMAFAVKNSAKICQGVVVVMRTDENSEIDGIDREIIRELPAHARISFRDLGVKVHLSPNATAERVRRLLESGVIGGFHAEVDRAKFGHSLQTYIDNQTEARNERTDFSNSRADAVWHSEHDQHDGSTRLPSSGCVQRPKRPRWAYREAAVESRRTGDQHFNHPGERSLDGPEDLPT